MPSGTGSMMSTAPTSTRWGHAKRSVYANKSVDGYEKLTTLTTQLHDRGQIPLADLNLVKIKLRIARLGLVDAEAAYRKAKLDLGSLMNLTLTRSRRSSCAGRSSTPHLHRRRSTELRRSPWPNGPMSPRSGLASRMPKPTSGSPRPTRSATCMSSGSRIPFRTTPLTA